MALNIPGSWKSFIMKLKFCYSITDGYTDEVRVNCSICDRSFHRWKMKYADCLHVFSFKDQLNNQKLELIRQFVLADPNNKVPETHVVSSGESFHRIKLDSVPKVQIVKIVFQNVWSNWISAHNNGIAVSNTISSYQCGVSFHQRLCLFCNILERQRLNINGCNLTLPVSMVKIINRLKVSIVILDINAGFNGYDPSRRISECLCFKAQMNRFVSQYDSQFSSSYQNWMLRSSFSCFINDQRHCIIPRFYTQKVQSHQKFSGLCVWRINCTEFECIQNNFNKEFIIQGCASINEGRYVSGLTFRPSASQSNLDFSCIVSSRSLNHFVQNDSVKYYGFNKKFHLNHLRAATELTRSQKRAMRERLKEIASILANDSIEWGFNPPSGPHFGGIYEAGVKSMKFHLKSRRTKWLMGRVLEVHPGSDGLVRVLTLRFGSNCFLLTRPIHKLCKLPFFKTRIFEHF